MKNSYFINISNEEYFQSETLYGLIASLEKLEIYKDLIFSKLNKSLTERTERLCSLKSRINRVYQIISNFSTSSAMTIKSKFNYPRNEHIYYQSVYYEPNALVTRPAEEPAINTSPENEKENLGHKPLIADDMLLHLEEIKQSIEPYQEIVSEISEEFQHEWGKYDNGLIQPILNYSTSGFDFYKKKKLNQNDYDTKDYICAERESKIVPLVKPEVKKKIEIEDAPLTINQKINEKRVNILQGDDKDKYQFNVSNNISLGGVATLAVHTENEEESLKKKIYPSFMEDDENEDENDLEDIDVNVPLDNYIKNKSFFVKGKTTNEPNAVSQSSTITSVPSSVPTPPSSVPTPPSNIPTPPSVPTPPSIPTPPSVPSVPSSVPKPPAGVPVPPPLKLNQPTAPPKAPPTAPTAIPPTPPPIPPVQVVGAPIGGSVPPPPPLVVPKVDPALAQKRKEEAEKKAAAAPKKPIVKELSMHEQLAMVKLKKVDPKEEKSKLIIYLYYLLCRKTSTETKTNVYDGFT